VSLGNWGVNAGLFGQNASEQQNNEGYALAARGHYAFPYGPEDSGNVVHLGASARYRNFDNDTFNSQIQYRNRPFFHFTNTRSVDIGTIDDAEGDVWAGGEFAWVQGPFSLQSEIANTALQRKHGEDDANNLWGGYLGADYFLTGEHRNYDLKRGFFDRVKVKSPQDGGFGAWQIGARADYIDLNDEGVKGGEQISYIDGLNWYPNDYIRFMLNGAVTQVFDAENSQAAADGNNNLDLRRRHARPGRLVTGDLLGASDPTDMPPRRADLRHAAAHGPGGGGQRARAVRRAGAIGTRHRRVDTGAVFFRQARDVGAERPLAAEQRLPVVGEAREVHPDGQRASLDVPQTARLPQARQTFWLGQRVGEQAVARQPSRWIDRRSGVPEQALADETAAKIPDRGSEHPARARDAAHFQHGTRGVGHEVERQLGDHAGKRACLERQAGGIGQLEMSVPAAVPPLCKGQVSGRDVYRKDAPVREAAPQLKRDAAGAASNVEHRAVARQPGEVDQDPREAAGPAPEKAFVGCPVVRPVDGGGAISADQSTATMTSDALITAEASWPAFSLSSSTASLVIDEVTILPPPMSIRTCAVV
jgi:Phosphate-selective porin O and P